MHYYSNINNTAFKKYNEKKQKEINFIYFYTIHYYKEHFMGENDTATILQ